ncbi:MAG: aminopeptidase [Gammaproteobacteria bacterium]|nr:aminopeptidase [Gammaproteobacteria bacterium]
MNVQRLLIVILLAQVLTACNTVQYYGQSISGQLSLLWKRQDIQELLDNNEIDEATRDKLKKVLGIRRFASDVLLLPDNGSYTSYADLGRPYVVWNVFAAPQLSVQPKTWCFPVAGCVPYRGYFSRDEAQAYADTLKQQGYDVYVGGITAYSTLGWFDDPVLNTILRQPEPQLAGLLFHELAHQKLYIKDDATFNESFATAVELEGVRRWLARHQASATEFRQYEILKQRHAEFIALLQRTRSQLDMLYSGELKTDIKLYQKTLIFSEMHRNYESLKKTWNNDNRYDNWFKSELNNARLVTVGTYHDYVPGFQALLKQHDNDLATFFMEAEKLAQLDANTRRQRLMQN